MALHPLAGEREYRESTRAVQACNDYLRMGPGRSVRELHRRYAKDTQNLPPSRSRGTLKDWGAKYGWIKRGQLYDEQLEAQKNAKAAEIMNSGLALAHERVERLQDLADFLADEVRRYDRVWLPDVKQIGSGNSAERVDLERFNSALIDQYRGTLDDLAKETGGRVKKSEFAGPGGKGPAMVIIAAGGIDVDKDI